ncbi:MAG TPA: hypothetical protein VN726_17325 [Hanamia sp.]|nr:hypothetical protein [Hanamia sp.]
MTRFFFFILLFVAQISFGQTSDTSFGKPIFWYQVSDPWAMFMGAEGPVFILYNSGKVLFWKNHAYYLKQLSEDEKSQIISDLDFNDTLFNKSRYFNATNPDPNGLGMATDNPSYTVSVNRDSLVRVSVYGYISSKEYRKRFPPQILQIDDFVLNFEADKSYLWIPDKVEVMLSDYSNSPDTPIKWPSNWPDLNSSDTRKHGANVLSIYLDKKYFGKLRKLIKKRHEKQAFEINGKKFFIGYRFQIPGLY